MKRGFVTVTFNPAIDQTVALETWRAGSVHRARSIRYDVGGKGINVASCLADYGAAVVVTGLLGSTNSSPFEALFARKKLADHLVRIPGDTRTNIKLVTVDDGVSTEINLPGTRVGLEAAEQVSRALARVTFADTVVVLSGSVPDGLPDDLYARVTADVNARGARVVLDTSGPPLRAAITADASALPACIKPNRDELESWAGRTLGPAELLEVAQALHAQGIGMVVVSLGGEGALFVTGHDSIHAGLVAPVESGQVGAGDAMVAGLALAISRDASLEQTARLATAFAVGKLGQVGSNLPPAAMLQDLCERTNIMPASSWVKSSSKNGGKR